MDKLCTHLPKSLVNQCESFVQEYSKQVMEMIIADLTPQEVCVYLKLCDPEKKVGPEIHFYPLDKDGEISKLKNLIIMKNSMIFLSDVSF